MPVFAFTAGSLGDILALIGVVRGLSSSLSDIYSQTGALRELVDDVALFARAIDQIKKTVDRRDGGMHEDVLLGIREHLIICRDILLVVTSRIAAFNGKMATRGGLTMDAVRAYWALAAWEILGGREEVDRLRARLRDQVSAIHIYLALAQCKDQDAVLTTACSHHVHPARILNAQQDVQRCFGSPAVPSFPFTDQVTGLPFAPCARTSIQHVVQLFPEMCFPTLALSLSTSPIEIILQYLDEGYFQHSIGFARCWIFDTHCSFYRGDFGCYEVFIGVHPQAAGSDAAAMQSLYRDLVMKGHIDLAVPGAARAAYRTIKARGDFLNRIVTVYEELSREFCNTPWNFYFKYQRMFEAFIRTFPDPGFLEATVLPRMRHISHIAFEYYDRQVSNNGPVRYPWSEWGMRTPRPCFDDFLWDIRLYEQKIWREYNLIPLNTYFRQVLGLSDAIKPEFQLSELWRMVEGCPLLDPAIVAQYKLTENIQMFLVGEHVNFRDASLDLVRAAARVPDFWKGL